MKSRRRIVALVAVLSGLALAAQSAQATVGPVGFDPPTGVAFGAHAAGTTTAQTVTLTNEGDEDLVFDAAGVSLTGTNAGQFAHANDTCSGATVPAGLTCTFDVRFSPTTHVDATAAVSFSANVAIADYPLSGTGQAGEITESAIPVFPKRDVGTVSPPRNVTIRNAGNIPVTVGTPSTGNAAFVIQSTTCAAAVLAPNATCRVMVAFAPVAPGVVNDTLTVPSDANTATGPLSGTGIQGAVTITPASHALTFTSQVGVASGEQQIKLKNTGNSSVTITAHTVPGGDFTVSSDTCTGVTLAGAATCAIGVTFTPSGPGAATEQSIDISYTGAADTHQTVTLDGTGTQGTVNVSTTAITFPDTPVGQTSMSIPITVTNNGTADVTMGTASLPAGDFQIATDNCSGNVVHAGGDTCAIRVNFTPSAAGASAERTVTIAYTGAPGSPQSVTLDGNGIQGTVGISPADGNIDFPDTVVGQSSNDAIVVTNNGTATVHITSPIAQPGSPFSIVTSGCAGKDLAPGDSCTIPVTFTPTARGAAATGTVTIAYTGAPGSPQSVTLDGNGLRGVLGTNKTAIAFPPTALGTTSSSSVTVSNTGDADMHVAAPAAPGGDFSVDASTCTAAVLHPGDTCSVGVTYSPSAIGASAGKTLTITSTDADGSPKTVNLTGSGIAGGTVGVTPGTLPFGQVPVTTTSAGQTVTVKNSGTAPVTMGAVSASGSQYQVTNGCAGKTLAISGAAASCTITVAFAPTATGADPQTLTIAYTGADTTQSTVALTGTGTQAVIGVSPGTIPFDPQPVGTTSPAQTITVTNSGTADTTMGTVSLPSGPYAITADNCSGNVVHAGGDTCIVKVAFTPTVNGAAPSRLLSIPFSGGGAANSPKTVNLSGSGTPGGSIAVTPGTLAFGQVPVGTTSAGQTVTVTNSGTDVVVMGAVTLPAGSDYQLTNGCAGVTLATSGAAAKCTITVAFKPIATGADPDTLTVKYTGADTTQATVALTGAGTQAVIGVTPGTIPFGPQAVGTTSAAQTVTVTNSGSADATMGTISLPSGPYSITADTCSGNVVHAGGDTCVVKVAFTPTVSGAAPGRLLSIPFSGGGSTGSPKTVNLSGTGTPGGSITVAPTSLAFGQVPITTTSAGQTVTVTNSGTDVVVMGAVTVPTGSDYVLTNGCAGKTLATSGAAAKCTITVAFAPTTTGADPDALTIRYTGADTTQNTVALTGTGTQAVIGSSPATIAFPDTDLGTTSPAQTITVTNSGTADATIGTVALPTGPFGITADTCTGTVIHASGGSCTVKVAFTPTAVGAAPGRTVTIPYSGGGAAGTARTVTLTGNGTPGGTVTIDKTALDFGNVKVGTTSVAQTVTLKNTGTSTVAISSGGAVFQPQTAPYTMTDGCAGKTLAVSGAAASCTVTLSFKPTDAADDSSRLSISYSGADDGGKLVDLSGTGTVPALTFAPATGLAFSTPVGSTSAAQTLTVKNTGNAVMNVSGVTLTGTNKTLFHISTTTCGTTIAAGGSCTVGVTFSPTSSALATASIQVADDAAGAPHLANLSGTGTVPGIQTTPTSLTFDPLQDGLVSAAKPVTIKNTGAAPLVIGTITVTGTNSLSFIIKSGGDACSGKTIAPAGTCIVQVQFRPRMISAKVASLSIPSNAGSTANVALAGNSIAPPPVTALKGAVGCTTALLTWTAPSAPQFNRVVVVRNRDHEPTSPTDGTVLTHGTGTLSDSKLVMLNTYHYAVFAVYTAYDDPERLINAKPAVIGLFTSRVCSPMNGASIADLTPLVDWNPFTAGSTYAIRLVNSGGTTINVKYPTMTQFQILASWSYGGATRRLGSGQTYTCYVYAYNSQYPVGRLIGFTKFTER